MAGLARRDRLLRRLFLLFRRLFAAGISLLCLPPLRLCRPARFCAYLHCCAHRRLFVPLPPAHLPTAAVHERCRSAQRRLLATPPAGMRLPLPALGGRCSLPQTARTGWLKDGTIYLPPRYF